MVISVKKCKMEIIAVKGGIDQSPSILRGDCFSPFFKRWLMITYSSISFISVNPRAHFNMCYPDNVPLLSTRVRVREKLSVPGPKLPPRVRQQPKRNTLRLSELISTNADRNRVHLHRIKASTWAFRKLVMYSNARAPIIWHCGRLKVDVNDGRSNGARRWARARRRRALVGRRPCGGRPCRPCRYFKSSGAQNCRGVRPVAMATAHRRGLQLIDHPAVTAVYSKQLYAFNSAKLKPFRNWKTSDGVSASEHDSAMSRKTAYVTNYIYGKNSFPRTVHQESARGNYSRDQLALDMTITFLEHQIEV